jgi:hypothetical protein
MTLAGKVLVIRRHNKFVDGQWTDDQRDALEPILAAYWQPPAF